MAIIAPAILIIVRKSSNLNAWERIDSFFPHRSRRQNITEFSFLKYPSAQGMVEVDLNF